MSVQADEHGLVGPLCVAKSQVIDLRDTPDATLLSEGGTAQFDAESSALSVSRWLSVGFSRARVLLDAASILAAVVLALALRFDLGVLTLNDTTAPKDGVLLATGLLWMVSMLGAMRLQRLYDEDTLFPGGGELARVVRSALEATAVVATLGFALRAFIVSRGWFLLVVLLSIGLTGAQRTALSLYLRAQRAKGAYRRPAILVSRDGRGRPGWFQDDAHEFQVVAHLSAEQLDSMATPQTTVASRRAPAKGAEAVLVVKEDDFTEDELWRMVLHAGQSGLSVFFRTPIQPVARHRLSTRALRSSSIVKVAPPTLNGLAAAQKRAFDITMSALALLVGSPLLLVIALAVLITSGRPIFYGQTRVGQGGRSFRMWKFRSMRPQAEAETGPVWASVDDPRRTPIGGILRRTSLDELPQLWNVLIGDMSVVGPRPERPEFVDRFAGTLPWYRYRHRIRPGLTGLAQSRGLRGNTPLDQRVESDNEYIEHWSIGLDLLIICQTVTEVLRGDHAC